MVLDYQCKKCKKWYGTEYADKEFNKTFLEACDNGCMVTESTIITCPYCGYNNKVFVNIIGVMRNE